MSSRRTGSRGGRRRDAREEPRARDNARAHERLADLQPRARESSRDGLGGWLLVVIGRSDEAEADLRRHAPAELLARALRHVGDIIAARELHLPEDLARKRRVAHEHNPNEGLLSGGRGKAEWP